MPTQIAFPQSDIQLTEYKDKGYFYDPTKKVWFDSNPESVPASSPIQPQDPTLPAQALPTQDPTQAPIQPTQPTGQTGIETVEVQQGDNLSVIASRYGLTYQELYNANKGQISDPNLIQPGQVLTIPQSKTSVTEQPTATGDITGTEYQEDVTPETNKSVQKLADSGITIDEDTAMTNPTGSWQSTYQDLYTKLGLDTVKAQIDKNIAAIQEIDNELAEEVANINNNPWLSEGLRKRKISNMENKYNDKKQALVSALTLYQNAYDDGRQEAQFLVTTALGQYNADRIFDFNEQKELADQAEASAKALADLIKIDPNRYEKLQDGLWDIEEGKWVVQPKEDKADAGGLTPAQINSTINSIAGAFDNEPIVKDYNTSQAGYQTIKTIGVNTTSPADDIAFIYAFAKLMDPGSVVREGEYNTVQRYAQSWADNFGFSAKRIYSNTNFLTPDAKQKMLDALEPKISSITAQYDNLASEYQRQIDDAKSGKTRTITDYGKAFEGSQKTSETSSSTWTSDSGKIYNLPW